MARLDANAAIKITVHFQDQQRATGTRGLTELNVKKDIDKGNLYEQ